MATKQYENFGVKNNVQKSPLLAARYGRGQVYGQRLANDQTGQSLWAKDPWFMLGSSIGQAWGDAYNERGISKGRAEMQGILNNYLGQQQQPQEQQGVLANSVQQAGGVNVVPVGDSAQIENGAATDINNAIGQPLTQHEMFKQGYLSNYQGADPNPGGTAITVKNDTRAISQMGDNINFDQVNKEDAREYVRQQLLQNGRTPYQVEQILGQFDSLYDSKQAKWNEAKGTDYFNKGMSYMQGDNPDYNNAFMNLAAAASRGNKEAAMMLQRLQYMQARQDKLADMQAQRDFQREMYNMRVNNRVGGGGRPRTTAVDENGNPIVNRKQYKKDGMVVEEGELSDSQEKTIAANSKRMDELVKRNGGQDFDMWANTNDKYEYEALLKTNTRLLEATRPIYLHDNDGGSYDYAGQGLFDSLASAEAERNQDELELANVRNWETEQKEKALQEEQRKKAREGSQNILQAFGRAYMYNPNRK